MCGSKEILEFAWWSFRSELMKFSEVRDLLFSDLVFISVERKVGGE